MWLDFTHCSGVSIGNFEQENTSLLLIAILKV